MARFANPPVHVDDLPMLDDGNFAPISRRALQVTLGQILVTALVVLVGATIVTVTVPDTAITTGAAAAAAVMIGVVLVIAAVWAVVAHRRLGYQLRQHDISMRSGVIIHRVATIPFARVQHVTVHRGPLERLIGLSTLEVSSAGPDLKIPGLELADAERIKLLVTERAGVDETADENIGEITELSDETVAGDVPPSPPTLTPPTLTPPTLTPPALTPPAAGAEPTESQP